LRDGILLMRGKTQGASTPPTFGPAPLSMTAFHLSEKVTAVLMNYAI
jgi:hypothetical protein